LSTEKHGLLGSIRLEAISAQSRRDWGARRSTQARGYLERLDTRCAHKTQSYALRQLAGKAVIYYELRRELRFKGMLLEANVEPELEGKVMPAFIYEVRTQFLFVAFAQQLRTEMEAFCQKSHVITILLAVSL